MYWNAPLNIYFKHLSRDTSRILRAEPRYPAFPLIKCALDLTGLKHTHPQLNNRILSSDHLFHYPPASPDCTGYIPPKFYLVKHCLCNSKLFKPEHVLSSTKPCIFFFCHDEVLRKVFICSSVFNIYTFWKSFLVILIHLSLA